MTYPIWLCPATTCRSHVKPHQNQGRAGYHKPRSIPPSRHTLKLCILLTPRIMHTRIRYIPLGLSRYMTLNMASSCVNFGAYSII
ncbi:hypothetical protein SCLCIDRAFT_1141876 [Scleroderma citrinum Foug A]|uniref:Uncharacterized protein n=1 Tax=Scleroderma citrinum Foug A TaxID=1036808 RepID=A0A0C2Z5T7_9AGAM|nr:hypothetical protein SCLCIDRAFT_1141876 [Scleroderma citrinum Foug A]